MMKKMIISLSISLLLSLSLFPSNTSNDVQGIVYSHGFGEYGPFSYFASFFAQQYKFECEFSGPTYPDAPGRADKAVFYTKPAVIALVNHLHTIVQSGKNVIHLIGFSCGGGTAINALAKLTDYENNKNYFKDSGITSQDAQAIIDAINKGSLVLSAPLLDVTRSNLIMNGGAVLSGVTCAVSMAALYYATADRVNNFVLSRIESYVPSRFKSFISSALTKVGFFSLGCCVYFVLGKYLKNMYANKFVNHILPIISHSNFDPTHETPVEGLYSLQGKLMCPILVHINENDGILQVTDDDKIQLSSAFDNGKMELLITNDGSHNELSQQLRDAVAKFNDRYFKKLE